MAIFHHDQVPQCPSSRQYTRDLFRSLDLIGGLGQVGRGRSWHEDLGVIFLEEDLLVLSGEIVAEPQLSPSRIAVRSLHRD